MKIKRDNKTTKIILIVFNLLMLTSVFIFLDKLPEFIYSLDYFTGYVKFLNDSNESLPLSNIYEILGNINNMYLPVVLFCSVTLITIFYRLRAAIISLLCEILCIMTMIFIIGTMIIIHYMAMIVVV